MRTINEVKWDQIKLTVVMPLFNCEKYVKQAIDSVLSQRTDFAVLLAITDDASVDSSAQIVDNYEACYPQKILAVHSEKNQGLLANDIKILAKMKSQYFCVLDPDDYWVDSNFLQKAIDFLDMHLEYISYGSNTKRLINDKLEKDFYINTKILEHTCNGIEDYLSGNAFVTHTTASIYRNVIFQNGVPPIMESAIGTLAEASFRGDVDRYVMHLKYGKAKFINEWVGVYRIHENGICQGTTMFHWKLMNARAEIDYSSFYDDIYADRFLNRAKGILKEACVEVYKAGILGNFFRMSDYDRDNFAILMNLCSDKNGDKRKRQINFRDEELKVRKLLRNKEKRHLILWGTGKSTGYLLDEYEIADKEITCFVDGDINKIGTEFCDKRVIAPIELKQIRNKYVVIMSSYYDEILERIEREELCSQEDVINLFWYNRYISNL